MSYQCEKCGESHEGIYASGRFCSVKCARSASTVSLQKTRKKRSKVWSICDEKFVTLLTEASTLASVAREIGVTGGSVYPAIRKRASDLGVDISHIPSGKNHNSGRIFAVDYGQPFDQLSLLLKKQRIWKEQNFGCEMCSMSDEWNGKKLVMQLDHRNGVKTDNSRKNLRLVCPNCHSQTPTWAGKNAKR